MKWTSISEINKLTKGKRVVATSGCFDILHVGHVDFLKRCKALGDVLVVLLNGDDSIKRLKGPSRPINSFSDRQEILSELQCVDYIVDFHEDVPIDEIQTLKPALFVKDSSYANKSIAEIDFLPEPGQVVFIPQMNKVSTTKLIKKIKRL